MRVVREHPRLHEGVVLDVTFTDDGASLVSAGGVSVRVTPVRAEEPGLVLPGMKANPTRVRTHARRRSVLAQTRAGDAFVWSLEAPEEPPVVLTVRLDDADARFVEARFGMTGDEVHALATNGGLYTFGRDDGARRGVRWFERTQLRDEGDALRGLGAAIEPPAWSFEARADGLVLATPAQHGGAPQWLVGLGAASSFSARADAAAATDDTGTLFVFFLDGAGEPLRHTLPRRHITTVALHPHAPLVAIGDEHRGVALLDFGEVPARLEPPPAPAAPSSHPLLRTPMTWLRTGDAETPYAGEALGRWRVIQVNDFPAPPAPYTAIGEHETIDVPAWPACWQRPAE